jgi:hypothetical protein
MSRCAKQLSSRDLATIPPPAFAVRTRSAVPTEWRPQSEKNGEIQSAESPNDNNEGSLIPHHTPGVSWH